MPTPDQVRRALKAIKRRADYEYFFEQLSSPEWIDPLADAGMFSDPDPPEEEGNYVRFPFWPPSRYLARVSPRAPEKVLRVLLRVPKTENVRVHDDFVDAALAMPPNLAGAIVDMAVDWLDSPYQLLLPHKLGELLSHLARGNETAPALKLTKALLEVRAPLSREGEGGFADRDPMPRFQEYEYEEILKRHVPSLVRSAGTVAVELLADVLQDANRISSAPEELERGDDVLDDYSYIWRPAVEEHEQNHPSGVRGPLIATLRDGLEYLVEINPSVMPTLVESLERRRWIIFYRLVLHLLRLFPNAAQSALVSRATDEWRFDDFRLRHEYSLLLRERFSLLPESAQSEILSRIDAGPALELLTKRAEENQGRRPTDEEVQRYVTRWKLERLSMIGEQQLPAIWLERYRQWIVDLGAPEHPEFPFYSTGVWRGPTSPKDAADLRAMTMEEILAFLKSWEPSAEWMSPSREGLGRVLQEVVAASPDRFVEAAEAFGQLHPTYVRALLSGFREAGKDKSLDWRPVLPLCEWVMGQSRETAAAGSPEPIEREEDPGWAWSRRAVADLIDKGLHSGPLEIPFELRSKVWPLLEALTADPEPDPAFEARYGGSNMDPATLALNTIRGAAMHAVMRYVIWVRRLTGPAVSSRGLDEVPEVKVVLEGHLDPMSDPSLAIRAVYGQWLPWLINWDRDWVSSQISRILPRSEALSDLRDAAWETYVTFSPAYNDAFEVLRDEYRLAVDRIGRGGERRRLADPVEKLGEHLVTLYWRGLLSLSESDSALIQYFDRASPAARAYVMRYIGISLKNTPDAVPAEVQDRLRQFWAWRVSEVRRGTGRISPDELVAFGWWYASDKLDAAWALDQLAVAVELAGRAEPEDEVLERLASAARDTPYKAVEVLREMVERASELWRVLTWRAEVRAILTTALQSGNARASEVATDLIQALGARSVRDFADLLPRR